MKLRSLAAFLLVLSLVRAASAHRLDEFLQATIVSVGKGQVHVSMRLIPGVAVAPAVINAIDADGDGVFSLQEQLAYAQHQLDELVLTSDGKPVKPRLDTVEFPSIELIREGMGEIHIELTVDVPDGDGDRRFAIQSHRQDPRAAYLMNALVPSDAGIRIVSQQRNQNQSFYEVDYTQAGGARASLLGTWWSGTVGAARSVGLPRMFELGVRHIAEGTDHLLFLLVLLLPAPLLVVRSRWAGCAGVRMSLLRILRIVTAFTVGHSITLALAACGFVSVPSRPIEVLIAVSILISAVHALRPVFPGREAAIAGFFGLIHGLAFASALGLLGLGRGERLAAILAFNLGIETMQLVVVAATLPSLLLLSRTRAYPALRIGGAVFAGIAATGWIAERTFGITGSVDSAVNSIAHHAPVIAASLFAASVVFWWAQTNTSAPRTATEAKSLGSLVTGTLEAASIERNG